MDAFSVTSLTTTCSSLSSRAVSASSEIDAILKERDTSGARSEAFVNLAGLSTKLQQFRQHVDQLRECLGNASVLSPELQTRLPAILSESDGALAVMTKQIMRLGSDTRSETINARAIARYEASLDALTSLLIFVTPLLSLESMDDQEVSMRSAEAKSLFFKAHAAPKAITKSGSILLDGTSAPSSKRDAGAPPSFEDSAATSPGASRPAAEASSSKSSGGFFDSLTNSFMAMTAAMRPKPEPFVVPLCQAATHGSVAQMKMFLNEGAKINGHNENGHTALICAILARQLEAVEFLLSAGADHTARDAGRRSKPPVFHAIDARSKELVDVLFQRGVNINEAASWGQPYFVDVITGDTPPEWIALLLSRGASANTQDVHGRKIVVRALLDRKTVDDREEVVTMLLRHGADANSRDLHGTPLIHHALQQKRDGLVSFLLGMGADVNARDSGGTPLLIEALKRKDLAMIKLLLDRGADPNVRDIYGAHTVVIILKDATLSGPEKEVLVEMLLRRGARGNERDVYGTSALEHTLSSPDLSSSLKIPALLLQNGADANQRLSKQTGEPTLLTYAIEKGRWDLARVALTHGATVNTADKKGRTPLVLALQRGKEDVVSLLISRGADMSLAGMISPLDLARAMGNRGIVEMLKRNGAVGVTEFADEEDELAGRREAESRAAAAAAATAAEGSSAARQGPRRGEEHHGHDEDGGAEMPPPYEAGSHT